MKLTCNMMDDLLPLYIEEACAEDSRLAVEEHLSQCIPCCSKLERMQKQIMESESAPPQNMTDVYRKKVRRYKTRRIFLSVLQTILVLFIAVPLGIHMFRYVNRIRIEGEPTEIRMIHYFQDAPGTSMPNNRTDITFSDSETIEAIMDEISGTYTMEIFAEEYFQSALNQHEFCITLYGLDKKIDFHVTDKGWIRIDDINYSCSQKDAFELYENLLEILNEHK